MNVDYQNTVNSVVRNFKIKYRLSSMEADDLHSAIVLRLADIAQDPTIDTLLEEPKYLKTCVLNAALNHLKTVIRHRNRMTALVDYNTIPAEQQNIDDAIWLSEALSLLTPAQLQVIGVYYGLNGMPSTTDWETMATVTGISRGQCKRLYNSAMVVLRESAK